MFAFPRPLCILGLALVFTTAHATDPINVYEGTLGERKVEVALQYTSQYEYVQGYLLDTERHTSLPLEITPYSKDVPLLINIMDDPRMPGAALRAAALSLEAFGGNLSPIDARMVVRRAAPGQAEVSARLARLQQQLLTFANDTPQGRAFSRDLNHGGLRPVSEQDMRALDPFVRDLKGLLR